MDGFSGKVDTTDTDEEEEIDNAQRDLVMDIDDKDFPLVRKNLNILSILILILAYTNAKLDSLNFLGIQIDLNAHKLYVAIFILYIYMIWRFLTKLPLRGGFWNGFEQFYMDGDEGVKKSTALIGLKITFLQTIQN